MDFYWIRSASFFFKIKELRPCLIQFLGYGMYCTIIKFLTKIHYYDGKIT